MNSNNKLNLNLNLNKLDILLENHYQKLHPFLLPLEYHFEFLCIFYDNNHNISVKIYWKFVLMDCSLKFTN